MSRRALFRAAAPAFAAGALGLAAACADAPTGPGSPAPARAPSLSSSPGSTSGTSAITSTLNIDPTRTATFSVGSHKVQIVAGSICDPATSGYGPALWDAPCTPAKTTVKVTTRVWTGANGHPVVTFSPDLRFVPHKVNKIWLLDRSAAAQQKGVLAWCPTGSGVCVDESITDPSLTTAYTSDGYAFRRLKHFSGYTVVAY